MVLWPTDEGPVNLLTEADLFAFRATTFRRSKPSVNHDLANIHTMLKLFAPQFPFPKRIFFGDAGTIPGPTRWRSVSFLSPPFRGCAACGPYLMRLTEVRRLRRGSVSFASELSSSLWPRPARHRGPQHGLSSSFASWIRDSPGVPQQDRGPYSRTG
jgi:hypothetical protein